MTEFAIKELTSVLTEYMRNLWRHESPDWTIVEVDIAAHIRAVLPEELTCPD